MNRLGARAAWHLPAVMGLVLSSALVAAAPAGGAAVAGIGGVHRTGFWTPLVLPRPDRERSLRAWAEDADGQLVGSPPATAAGPDTLRVCVRPGRPAARLAIEPDPPEQGRVVAASAAGFPGTVVSSTTPLLLVLGDLPTAAAAARLVAGERTAMEVVRLTDGPLPPALTPRDLDAFDAAVVCGRALGGLAPDAIDAIDGWARRGGRLVVIAGESAAAVAAAGGSAAGWLPGANPELVPLRRFGALETYARAGGLTGRAPRDGGVVPRFTRPAGEAWMVEVFEGSRDDLPLVIRRAHGFGTVTWLGLDIDASWCSGWPGSDRLLAALLGSRSDTEGGLSTPDAGRPRVADLAAQLRLALDAFPTVEGGPPARGVPFEIIAGLGVLYVLALYPLDWWLVSRSGRPGLAWVTLPVLAAGFTAAAWAVGGLWGRDAPARCHVAEVLDIDAASRFVRGFTWLAARSPVNAMLDVEVAAAPHFAASGPDAAVSWFADAGRGLGGVDAAAAHPSLAAADYAYTDSLAALRAVPVAAASSRLFEAEWAGATAAPPATGKLTPDVRGLLRGTLAHHLPFPLGRCRLVHGGWIYDIGDLAPGQMFDIDSGRGPRSLAADLTRRFGVGDRDGVERWDSASGDVPRILEMACFHGAAGGSGYTSLEGGRLARLDLSPLLTVDRAVLVGIAPAGTRGTQWTVRLGGASGPAAPLVPESADAGGLVRIVIPLTAAGKPAEEPR